MAKLTGTPDADLLTGTPEDDWIYGFAGADTLRGAEGNDTLYGGLHGDLLLGGAGDDRLYGGADADTASWSGTAGRGQGGFYGIWIDLEAGLAEAAIGRTADGFWRRDAALERDLVAEVENATGSMFADHVGGDAADNVLRGLAGRDELEGGAGNDRLYGDAGADLVRGGDGDDALYGGSGADDLGGGVGADQLYGGGGHDRLLGDLGDDLLYGGDGDDWFSDGTLEPGQPEETGNDRYDGGAGRDTVDYQNFNVAADGRGVTVVLADGLSAGTAIHAGETDRLVGIENVTGSDRDDSLSGNGEDNVLAGLGGNDLIFGRGGNDLITVGSEPGPGAVNHANGGAGDDVLRGWGGSDDTLLGGSGADRLDGGLQAIALASDQDQLDLGQDTAIDEVGFAITQSVAGTFASGVDRVAAFDPARDVLALELRRSSVAGATSVVDARDFLDSDDNGVLDDADAEVALAGTDGLVLDLAAVWERAFATALPEDRPQAILLENVGSLAAERVAAPYTEPGWTVIGETDFIV